MEDLVAFVSCLSIQEHNEGGATHNDDTEINLYQLDEADKNEEPASQRVLATAELFEMILLGLPIRQLLIKIPLVCKHWQATIAASPKLQQALFFKPIPYEPLQLLKTEKSLQTKSGREAIRIRTSTLCS
jgi:hypothetical protein